MLLACLQVQNIYVPIVLSVLFGVMVVLGLAATVLLLMRRLRSGGTFLALLWFWTVIYMIAGPGSYYSYAPWHALLILIGPA